MKRIQILMVLLTLVAISHLSFGQEQNQKFKMEGINPETITINQTFTSDAEIFPFPKNVNKVFGVAVTAKIVFNSDESVVRLLFVDKDYNEHLIYEAYPLLEGNGILSVTELSEETALLNGLKAYSVKIEVTDAELELKNLTWTKALGQGVYSEKKIKEKKQEQNSEKISKINKNLKEKGLHWVAGLTEVAELTYAERKQLYGQGTFPAGFEYYAGGIISTGTSEQLKSAAATSPYVDSWDWRDRHGKNWITPIKNQGGCGSCWAFAATGAVEALVNVYFNQQINLDLSEQDLLSCSGAGNCDGGYPGTALTYITNNGIVNESAFPYSATNLTCSNKGSNPTDKIKIGGKIDFGSTTFPKTEDDLKRNLIQMGPISSGLSNWLHTMVLVGYKVVKENDVFYFSGLEMTTNWKTVLSGDPLIGKTVWIFKNSWGINFGDKGYVYVETPVSNIGWTHAIKSPVTSLVKNYEVICEDRDGDGYYWWGLGPKPTTCNCPTTTDGNDADPTLGPLDKYGNCIKLTNPPAANFTADKTVITQGESINFTDLSSSNTTSWAWTFEGGTPAKSNSKNPVVKYDLPGTYSVKLTASNSYGSNTKSIVNYITINEIIPFYCTSKGNATSEWISAVAFGVKISSVSSGEKGYKDITGSYTYIKNAGSVQSFSLTPGFLGEAQGEYWRIWADYNGDKDFDDPGELVFSSGLSTGVVTGSFTFPSNLNLTTRIRVAMKRGGLPTPCEIFSYGEVADYAVQINGTTTVLAPVANFSASKTLITKGETVIFSDLSTNSPTSWSWSFTGGTPLTSTAKNPSVAYNTAGTYKVVLTATNSTGSNTKTVEGYIQVNEPVLAPVANFSANKTVITKGETVTFSDLSTNSPTSWSWSFTGGTPLTSTSQNPAVTYNTTGTYKVVLTATNSAGSNTKTVEECIQVNEPVLAPVANFSANKTVITKGETVTFSDLSTNAPTSWSWSFTGGTPLTSTAKNPSVAYNTAGTYKVVLTATNSAGSNIKTVENYIQVNEPVLAPVAEFEAAKTTVVAGEQVQFNDLSQNDPTQWEWSFPGGTPAISNAKNPVVTYTASGEYDVTLTVSKPGTVSSKKVKLKYIVTIENTPANYCVPVAISSSPDFISSVVIGNVLTSTSTGNGYSFSGNLVRMAPGKSYTVTLTPKISTNRNFWKIWIDFNGDYDFSDAGETVVTFSNKKGAAKTSFTVPQYATGTTRMRIAMRNLTLPAECDDNYKGEVEDYPVSFEMAASSVIETTEITDSVDTDSQDINESVEMVATAVENVAFGISDGFKCYPNPVNQLLNVKLDKAKPGDFYTIFNINGGKVFTGKIESSITTIDFGRYVPGIYLLKVVNGENVFNERIIRK